MKPKISFSSAFLFVALVFGFASCSYDDELRPPQRLVKEVAVDNPGTTGKPATPVVIETRIIDYK
jgi:hypothetical protein